MKNGNPKDANVNANTAAKKEPSVPQPTQPTTQQAVPAVTPPTSPTPEPATDTAPAPVDGGPMRNEGVVRALAEIERISPECLDLAKHLAAMMDPNKLGFEEMGGARWTPENVRVHQGLTRNAPGNSKPGGLFTTGGDVLPQPFRFVPVYMNHTRAKFGENKELPECRSDDGKVSISGDICEKCPDGSWQDGAMPACAKGISVLVFSEDFKHLYLLNFSKTSYKAGAALYKQASQCIYPWERIYELNTEMSGEGSKKYYVFTEKPSGVKTPEKYYPLARLVYEQYKEARRVLIENNAKHAGERTRHIMNALPPDIGANAPKTAGKSSDPVTNI